MVLSQHLYHYAYNYPSTSSLHFIQQPSLASAQWSSREKAASKNPVSKLLYLPAAVMWLICSIWLLCLIFSSRCRRRDKLSSLSAQRRGRWSVWLEMLSRGLLPSFPPERQLAPLGGRPNHSEFTAARPLLKHRMLFQSEKKKQANAQNSSVLYWQTASRDKCPAAAGRCSLLASAGRVSDAQPGRRTRPADSCGPGWN